MKKLLLVMLAISACQHHNANTYEKRLSKWLGRPQSLLIQAWGEPNRQFAINSDTFAFVYIHNYAHATNEPYSNTLYYPALAGPRYGHSMFPAYYYCQTTFSIRNGIVVDYSFNGDYCI